MHDARNSVWPYLLGLVKPEWPANFIQSQLQSLRKGYNQLMGKCEVLTHPTPAKTSHESASEAGV